MKRTPWSPVYVRPGLPTHILVSPLTFCGLHRCPVCTNEYGSTGHSSVDSSRSSVVQDPIYAAAIQYAVL
jgi:hypothetical protein